MDNNSMNFDWNRARAFLATVEHGSLSAAARAIGMAQPTLGRQVTALEQELGVVLFERVGRGLTLTPSGEQLYEFVRKMGDAANEMSFKSLEQSKVVEGKVRLAVSEVFAAFTLPPILKKLRKLHPAIELEMVTSTYAADLLRREADIAIRYFHPKEPDLIAKKIGEGKGGIYASPEYIQKMGGLSQPSDLQKADFINIDETYEMMKALNNSGLNLSPQNFPFCTPNWLVMWEYVRQGLGIGMFDCKIADADPMVQRVLPKTINFPVTSWLVAHRELRTSARIRIVFDLLAAELIG